MNQMIGGPHVYDVVTCYNVGAGFSITKSYESGKWQTVELIKEHGLVILRGVQAQYFAVPPTQTRLTLYPVKVSHTEFYVEFPARYKYVVGPLLSRSEYNSEKHPGTGYANIILQGSDGTRKTMGAFSGSATKGDLITSWPGGSLHRYYVQQAFSGSYDTSKCGPNSGMKRIYVSADLRGGGVLIPPSITLDLF